MLLALFQTVSLEGIKELFKADPEAGTMPGDQDGAGRMPAEKLSMAEVIAKVRDKGLEEDLKRDAGV